MFKMPSSGENHGNPKFVAGINHFLVADAATRLHNEFYAVFVGSFNAVAKREKGIGNKYRFFKSGFFFQVKPRHGQMTQAV